MSVSKNTANEILCKIFNQVFTKNTLPSVQQNALGKELDSSSARAIGVIIQHQCKLFIISVLLNSLSTSLMSPFRHQSRYYICVRG
jgi:hypothetical protein